MQDFVHQPYEVWVIGIAYLAFRGEPVLMIAYTLYPGFSIPYK